MRAVGAIDPGPILTVASAATTDIGAARANTLSISGTTGITSFGTAPAGTYRQLSFEGVLTISYNGTSMILPGLQSITTVGGDTAGFVSLGGGNWRCVWYQRAVGWPLIERAGNGLVVNTTSGASIDIVSIPFWVREVLVVLSGVSTNGNSIPIVQLGTSSGVTTSGYTSWAMSSQGGALATSGATNGFSLAGDHGAAVLTSGILHLANLTGNSWVGALSAGENNVGNNRATAGGGQVSLSSTLDRVRLTTVNGTDQFDAGQLNIIYRA